MKITKKVVKWLKRISLALVAVSILSILPVTTSAASNNIHDILFQWEYYYENNADLQRAFGKNPSALRSHYDNYGKREGRAPSALFNPKVYLALYPDIKAAFGSDYTAAYNHFVSYGINEQRQGSAHFSLAVYKENYQDLRNAFGNQNFQYIWHFRYYGQYENRNAITKIGSTPAQASFSPVWPCRTAYTITCMYYYKDGSLHSTRYGYKSAIDISGGGDILAIESGTVITVQNLGDKSFGRYIEIKHDNGQVSLYAHLSSFNVYVGQRVSKGEKIGVMGNTGNSGGTHLHFELSGSNPFFDYYKDKYSSKISFEKNVYSNNARHNSDKSISNYIYANYYKSGSYYYKK